MSEATSLARGKRITLILALGFLLAFAGDQLLQNHLGLRFTPQRRICQHQTQVVEYIWWVFFEFFERLLCIAPV